MEPAAVVIIFNEQAEVLLLKRMFPQKDFSDHWGFPGGAVAGFEESFDAAIRETKEETNLEVWNLRRVKRDRDFLDVYTTRTFEGDIVLSFEHTDYVWVPMELLDNYKLIPGSKKLIEEAKKL